MLKQSLQLLCALSVAIFFFHCESDPVSSHDTKHDPDPPDPPIVDDNDTGSIRDIEGNVYHTQKIGKQIWTTQDFRTTKFNDGTDIPIVTDSAMWANLTTPAYCSYKNITNPDTIKKYGLLYDFYAVNSSKFAPQGWHVPSTAEWETLQQYLITHGYNWDESQTGNKIAQSMAAKSSWKKTDTIGSPGYDLSKNNRSGFSALPVGTRYANGLFGNRGQCGQWWSNTDAGFQDRINTFFMTKGRDYIDMHEQPKNKGLAVRLVKD